MILAKDLMSVNLKTRQAYVHSNDINVRILEDMYFLLQSEGSYETFDLGLAELASTKGYVVVYQEIPNLVPVTKEVPFLYFFKTKINTYEERGTLKKAYICLPEDDVQIENKRNYELFIVTNKGSNQSIKLTDMTQKEVKSYVEEAYKIGAIYTGYGFISTAVIDNVVIKEM